MKAEKEEKRVNLYEASVDVLVNVAGKKSIWRERWEKGDGIAGEDLQEWFNEQRRATPDDMYYKGSSGNQIMFVRDQLAAIFFAGIPYDERPRVSVVGAHHSKSVSLPVYRLEREDIGLRIYLRNNFYNWKLSVDSIRPIDADFTGLFMTSPAGDQKYSGNELAPCYFEGFPKHLIFGYYGPSDGRRWSAEISNAYSLWATLFVMLRSTGIIGRDECSVPAQHERELDAETARKILREKHPDVALPQNRIKDSR